MKNVLLMLLLVVSLLVSPAGLAIRASDRLISPQETDFTVSGSSVPTMQQVRDAIVSAGAARGWQVTAEQPGQMTLRNVIRGKYTVVVNVTYTTRNARVEYVSSDNLEFSVDNGVAYIHPKYNEWVATLLKGIHAKAHN